MVSGKWNDLKLFIIDLRFFTDKWYRYAKVVRKKKL